MTPSGQKAVDSGRVKLEALSLRDRWIYALKPRSWPKLLVSAALGQAIGVAVDGEIDPVGFFAGLLFVGFMLAAVVLLNDWGDRDVDALKRRLFPESCSPKTIPDGLLEARSVLWAGLGFASTAVGVAVAAQLILGRPGLAVGGIACAAIFWMYTFPPIKLNYRGGGEILEMVGVGFALPWWQAYCQSGVATPGGLVVLPAFALLALASALASGLADEPSDRLGGKTTFTTAFGGPAVRQAVEGLVLGGMIVWAILPRLAPSYASVWLVLPAIVVMLVEFRDLRRAAEAKDIATYHGLSVYKHRLHDCIWRGTTAMSVSLLIMGVLGGGLGAQWSLG